MALKWVVFPLHFMCGLRQLIFSTFTSSQEGIETENVPTIGTSKSIVFTQPIHFTNAIITAEKDTRAPRGQDKPVPTVSLTVNPN